MHVARLHSGNVKYRRHNALPCTPRRRAVKPQTPLVLELTAERASNPTREMAFCVETRGLRLCWEQVCGSHVWFRRGRYTDERQDKHKATTRLVTICGKRSL
jgi:hypothetical protein